MFYDITELLIRRVPNFRQGEQYCISVDGKIGIAKSVGNVIKPGYKPTDWTRYLFKGEYFDMSNMGVKMVKGDEFAPAMLIFSDDHLAKKEELPQTLPLAFLMAPGAKEAKEWNYNVRKPESPSVPKYCLLFGCPLWKVEELIDVENKYIEKPWIVRENTETDNQFILRGDAITKNLYTHIKSGKNGFIQFKTRDDAVKYMNRNVNWAIDEYNVNKDRILKCLRQAKFRVSNEAPEMVSVGNGMRLGVKYTCHSSDLDYDFIPDHIDECGFYRTKEGYIVDETIQANTSVINEKLTKAYGKYMSYRYIASTNTLDRSVQFIEDMLENFDSIDDEDRPRLVRKVKLALQKADEVA